MSETLPITNGSTDLENINSSEPVVNSVKETLPDSSTGNDSECAAGTIHLTAVEEHNGESVSVVDGKNANDDLDGAVEKFAKKEAINNDHITDSIRTEIETTPNAINDSDSVPEVLANVALERVKKNHKKVVKPFERVVRNVPRRAINGTRPKYAPVRREKRDLRKTGIVIPNCINELNNGVHYKESKDAVNHTEESDTTATELHHALPSHLPSIVISKEEDAKIIVPDVSVREGENEQNLESEASSATKNATAKSISLSSIKKETSPKKSVLSHFQIMRRVLNKKALYGALLVDQMFECPICHVRKQKAQYLLLHLKGHNDLTQVFERFQAFGGPLEEIEKETSELPKVVCSHNIIVPKAESPRVKKQELRRKKTKPILSEFGIPIFPLPRPKIKRKKIINKSEHDVQGGPVEINDIPMPSIASETPDVKPFVVPLLNPSLCRNMRKRKVPLKRISKRWPVTETYEEPPDDIIVDAKKSRLGISHTRALDPELLGYLKQVMRKKVTEDNPHKCKFCGKLFFKGQGIYAHYFKHSRAMASPERTSDVIPENEPLQDLKNGNSAFDDLIAVSDNEDAERNRDTDFLTLQELETNVNRLLRSLVKDTDVLRNLGWPERRVSDLVIDILERCNLQPSYCGVSRLSQLQCLRKNMGKLFRFCIKEDAMERYGWDIKLVDIVVREMIATEECMKLNRI